MKAAIHARFSTDLQSRLRTRTRFALRLSSQPAKSDDQFTIRCSGHFRREIPKGAVVASRRLFRARLARTVTGDARFAWFPTSYRYGRIMSAP
jgi:hypothetical protein